LRQEEVLFGGKYPIEAAGVKEVEEELEELEDILSQKI
jgi:hypothetical protein